MLRDALAGATAIAEDTAAIAAVTASGV